MLGKNSWEKTAKHLMVAIEFTTRGQSPMRASICFTAITVVLLNKIKEVVNPYFKKKFENFIKTYSIPPKTLIYSIFKIHSYFLKNLKIPPKTAN